ncbi:MAG: hypothetical protein LBJ91_00535 [Clostridiales Family XIII bacterium]|jgi:vacuolar-type H+-ATPase subunit I/STV1|nr:hypothetical protein [Clostridiales Family XIII bacterium]
MMDMQIFETVTTAIIAPVLLLCITTAVDSRKARRASEEQREHLHEALETLQSEVTSLREMITRQVKQTSSEIKAAKKRSRVVIHDRLSQAHRFYMEQGYVERDSARALNDMYDVYHKECGGNGYAKELMDDINSLTIKD